MEGFYYSFYLLFLLSTFIIGIVGWLRQPQSLIRKIVYSILIMIPLSIAVWNVFSQLFAYRPTDKALVGMYQIVSADNGIPEHDFHKYTLLLNEDSTFILSPTPDIHLCNYGTYEVDFQFSDNELSFRCEQTWYPKHIKRKWNGFEIEFFLHTGNGSKSICFGKIK